MKLYSFKDDSDCYPIDYFKRYMIENNLSELEVHEQESIKGSDYFYCKHFQEIGEKGICGKQCQSYQPRNSKSGLCKHSGFVYETTGKIITLKLK
jgi:hypothetical protein